MRARPGLPLRPTSSRLRTFSGRRFAARSHRGRGVFGGLRSGQPRLADMATADEDQRSLTPAPLLVVSRKAKGFHVVRGLPGQTEIADAQAGHTVAATEGRLGGDTAAQLRSSSPRPRIHRCPTGASSRTRWPAHREARPLGSTQRPPRRRVSVAQPRMSHSAPSHGHATSGSSRCMEGQRVPVGPARRASARSGGPRPRRHTDFVVRPIWPLALPSHDGSADTLRAVGGRSTLVDTPVA